MSIADLMTEEILGMLAIDLGLVILTGWFIILLLIIREFRKFARSFTKESSGMDENTLQMCQQSVDNALNYTSENNDTLNDLIQLQQALESQMALLRSSTAQHITPEEQASIDDLNLKLNKSHKLIRKLKGDLDKSVKGLRVTRKKLFTQTDTVDSLREENAALEKDFEKLEQEYIQISQAGGFQDLAIQYQTEKEQLLNTIEEYKQQAEQGGSGEDVEAMRQELEQIQQQLQHSNKEKDFVENKYLDLVKEMENDKPA
ncbi:chromosome partitioning protein ParA [uncultured Vibrio sp.]|uniref:chromosome partitioning protein ParA n=1 Tax=uncultured Vibrio sp. TaxID=114054 RepID=UPI00091E3577|nr:chromosome partitioning protein ParA [uncultured Vibrio sp.]OIQ24961.1 MAG: chromosome partitioning protein ParA [Vibrio sp. MedPE-SWchi]